VQGTPEIVDYMPDKSFAAAGSQAYSGAAPMTHTKSLEWGNARYGATSDPRYGDPYEGAVKFQIELLRTTNDRAAFGGIFYNPDIAPPNDPLFILADFTVRGYYSRKGPPS